MQNKLHRNAGPEDLVATETLLDRITGGSYGDVSQDAVNELRVFLAELRDFFNAGSLQDMLDAIRPAFDAPALQVPPPLLSVQLCCAGCEGKRILEKSPAVDPRASPHMCVCVGMFTV